MSRSYKKAIVKDRGLKNIYWRTIRSRWRTLIKSGTHPEDLPNEKSLINDWDYCDYIIDAEHEKHKKFFNREKLRRK